MKRTAKQTVEKLFRGPERVVATETMDLQRAAVLFALRIGQWRIRKNAERSRVETTAERHLVNVRKRILDSDEYRAITHEDTLARDYVLRQSLPSPLGRGVYLLPIELVRSTMEWLKAYQARRAELIEAFLAVYPERQAEMKSALGDLYDPSDYPEKADVRARYWVSTMMMELNAPTALKGISGALYQEEVARIRNVWEETRATISAALYEEMADLVGTLEDRLSGKAGEKDKVLRESVIVKFQEWLELFHARNLTKEGALADLVERAKSIVSGVSAKTIRESPVLRKELADEFKGLRAQLTKAIIDRPKRKIRLIDEE